MRILPEVIFIEQVSREFPNVLSDFLFFLLTRVPGVSSFPCLRAGVCVNELGWHR